LIAANLAPSLADRRLNKEAVLGALREGLGLSPPQEAFWKPVGELTAGLIAEDKIWLLVDFVPLFGRAASSTGGGGGGGDCGESERVRQRLAAFPQVLKATQETLEERLNGNKNNGDKGDGENVESGGSSSDASLKEGDKQLLAVELAITDFLLSPDKKETPESFAAWLSGDGGGGVTVDQLKAILAERKAFNPSAKDKAKKDNK
jgi:hypothetical protein